jgi:lipopolysaccharide heptosyltransferase I
MPNDLHPLAENGRLLIVRLGSMGDIVHALPAAAALRRRYPHAQIDWLVESRWAPLVASAQVASRVIPLEPNAWGAIGSLIRGLRATRYDWAVDFQGLYKSAVCAFLCGAPRRLGFSRPREAGARAFYTDRADPPDVHVVKRNLHLATQLGAAGVAAAFPAFTMDPQAQSYVRDALSAAGVSRYYMLSPGGGWRSKCWPAEQYGHLHRRIAERCRLRAIVSYGPGEKALAEAVRLVAGDSAPVLLPMDIPQLMAALAGCEFFIGADTGPLHLAAALGRRVVGLYGPTDPQRNGPVGGGHVVLRNAGSDATTYKRGDDFSPAMRSLRIEQVEAAVAQWLEAAP